jgi:predicted ATPase
VRRVARSPYADVDRTVWPFTLPAVAQLLDAGLDLPAGVTLLVGENGSGKSTLVEGLAVAYGLNAEGGSRGAVHTTRPSESPLGAALLLTYGERGLPSYFLRAETMHGLYTYLERNPQSPGVVRQDPVFHEMSHGESFLAVLRSRFVGRGFFLMDEPESALSFRSCLALLSLLDTMAYEGSQVVVATHSPLLASLPGAALLEVGEHGLREVAYDDLDLVRDWRGFLDAPGRYLRHLLADEVGEGEPG